MNTPEEIQSNQVSAVIEEGIPFTVTVNSPKWYHGIPFFPKSREFTIYPINLGTLLCMSEIIMTLDGFDAPDESESLFTQTIESIVKNTNKVAQIVALAVKNTEEPPDRKLVKFLRANLSAQEIFKILTAVIKQMDVQDFFYFIASLQGVNILQKMKKTSIKTSGEPSAQSSNITDSVGMKSSGNGAG